MEINNLPIEHRYAVRRANNIMTWIAATTLFLTFNALDFAIAKDALRAGYTPKQNEEIMRDYWGHVHVLSWPGRQIAYRF